MTPVIWLLGLSGSGKTTLGSLLRLYLEGQGHDVEFLDCDRFCQEQGLMHSSPEQKTAVVDALRGQALQAVAQDKICIVAASTPYASMRQKNREQLPLYREVWVRCSLQELVERDPKGFYRRAVQGERLGLCGLDDRFDEPRHAHMVIDTDRQTLLQSYLAVRQLCEAALQEAGNWLCSPYLPMTTLPVEQSYYF